MFKVIKYRILTALEDRAFFVLFALVFLVFNYKIIGNQGLMSVGSGGFNEELKYALLVNNFSHTTFLYIIILSIYTGSGLIGKDIQTNQIYLTLSVYPNRIKYIISNWISQVILVVTTIFIIVLNFYILGLVLDVSINNSDILKIFIRLFLNGVVIMTLTAVSSIFIRGRGSLITGVISICFYNIYIFSKIPIIEEKVKITDGVRKLLCTLTPITEPLAPSLIGTEFISERQDVLPYLINNILVYQIVFCVLVLIVGVISFKRKDI